MNYTALVPVKSLHLAKSRLHPQLTPDQRSALMIKMLGHVLITLRMCKLIHKIAVVTIDPTVISESKRLGADIILEEYHGHNNALHAAATQEKKAGAQAILTIAADLPLLKLTDISGLLKLSEINDVVLAPSKEGTGTNALLTRSPLLIPYLFGVNSFSKYLQAANEHHLHTGVYTSSTIELDIDTIEDLQLVKTIKPYY